MNKQHRQYINEWKSVSDDVKTLAEKIVNTMWHRSEDDKPMMDSVIDTPFIGGEFSMSMDDVFNDGREHFGVDNIAVWYRIYLIDSEEEYISKYMNFGNSEYNDDEKRLYIRGGLIRGQYNRTIVEDVYHELTHVFEYGMGMKKREELYNAVAAKINDDASLPVDVTMCKIVYYTFPHEQDAFAHQFYAYLGANGIYCPFKDALQGFQNFLDFEDSITRYTRYLQEEPDNVRNTLGYLGMTMEQFNKRFRFGRKRFVNKLRRVYQRYMYERSRKRLNVEGTIKRQIMKKNILTEYRKRYNGMEFERENDFKW